MLDFNKMSVRVGLQDLYALVRDMFPELWPSHANTHWKFSDDSHYCSVNPAHSRCSGFSLLFLLDGGDAGANVQS